MATEHERRLASSESKPDPNTHWVDLEHQDGSVLVEERTQMGILRGLSRYSVEALFDDDPDGADLLRKGDLSGFIDNEVVPYIRRPAAFWTDPRSLRERLPVAQRDDVPEMDDWADDRVIAYYDDALDDPILDVADLHESDLMAVITAMSGQTRADLEAAADGENRFQ